jgi:hypothetical protein
MTHHHRRPLTETEIAKIRQSGPGLHFFKRAKDTHRSPRIFRYITYLVFLVIAIGLGLTLYEYVNSNPSLNAFVARLLAK